MKKIAVFALFFVLALCPFSSQAQPGGPSKKAPVLKYELVHTYPHDPEAFTQGLVFNNGYLYESTGLYGKSSLRRVDLNSGKVLKAIRLPGEYFGEGIVIAGKLIYQLTWHHQRGFIFDLNTMQPIRTFPYSGEGWGITWDGKHLIMSNGSDQLRFIHPADFRLIKTVFVEDNGNPVRLLNELEYIGGVIYANVLGVDRLARISPQTGKVLAWVDLSGLRRRLPDPDKAGVLNGIAHDKKKNRLFVTGKNWPKLFQIKIRD